MKSPDWGFPSACPALAAGGADIDGDVGGETTVPGIFTLTEAVREGLPLTELHDFDFNTISPPQLLRTSGVPADVVDADFRDLQLQARTELLSADAVGYFALLVERLVQHYTLKVHRQWHLTTHVTFTEIHCPRRTGAVATFQRSAADSAQSAFELKLLGFKGGDGTTATLKVMSEVEAKDGRCYRIAIPVDVLVEEGSYRRGVAREFDSFVRMSPIRCRAGFRQEPIAVPCPHCNVDAKSWPKNAVSAAYDRRAAAVDESALVQLEIGEDRRAKAALDLEVPGISTAVQMVAEVATKSTVAYRYKLPGGASYHAYRPPRHPFYYWLVE